MQVAKTIEIMTTEIVHEDLLLYSVISVIFASFASLTFSVHSSTSFSTNFFLHLQFSGSKYPPISHDLSHSH